MYEVEPFAKNTELPQTLEAPNRTRERQMRAKVKSTKSLLLIENSIGHSGSAISLCNLVANLDTKQFCPFVIFSRPEQLAFFRRHFSSDAVAVIRSRPAEFKTTAIGRSIGEAAANIHPFAARIVYGAFSLVDLFTVFLPYVIRMAAYARNKDIDLIHQNNGFDLSAIVLATLMRRPLLAYQRGAEWNSPFTRFMARFVDIYLANSEQTKRDLLELNIPSEKIKVITPPVDLRKFDHAMDTAPQREEFAISEHDRCFGIVGTLLEWKGHRVFLKAAQKVVRRIPAARAFVIGGVPSGADPAFERELQALAAELGIADRVVFTGFRDDVPALMATQDVIVHASVTPEPFGRVIIEAMAMGKPVVASRAGGPLEIIDDGVDGFLVTPEDDSAFADRICALLSDRELARAMGREALLKTRRRYTVDANVEAVSEVYRTLLLRGRKRKPSLA